MPRFLSMFIKIRQSRGENMQYNMARRRLKRLQKSKTQLKHEKACSERYRRRRVNLMKKAVDLNDMFGTRVYVVVADDHRTFVLNSESAETRWPPAQLELVRPF